MKYPVSGGVAGHPLCQLSGDPTLLPDYADHQAVMQPRVAKSQSFRKMLEF
jgi:hypothetical protein